MDNLEPLPPPSPTEAQQPPQANFSAPTPGQPDPQRLAAWQQKAAREQNLPGAVLGGAIGAVGGAVAWAAVTVITNFQIGFMAIGVGILVGWLVRQLGKGMSQVFGVVGAVFAFLGCATGNLLTAVWMISNQTNRGVFDVLGLLGIEKSIDLLGETFSGMDLVFYGIAIWEGYKLSFRRLTEADVREITG